MYSRSWLFRSVFIYCRVSLGYVEVNGGPVEIGFFGFIFGQFYIDADIKTLHGFVEASELVVADSLLVECLNDSLADLLSHCWIVDLLSLVKEDFKVFDGCCEIV